jgi:TolA-binding protein
MNTGRIVVALPASCLMSAEAMRHGPQDATAMAVAAASATVADSDPATCAPCISRRCEERNQQLNAQMQRMQQQIDELKRKVPETAAQPFAGTSAAAASSSIRPSGISCGHCG